MAKKPIACPQKLDAAIKRKFGIKTETYFDLIGSMHYVTVTAYHKAPLTDEIHKFIRKWMDEKVPE